MVAQDQLSLNVKKLTYDDIPYPFKKDNYTKNKNEWYRIISG